jgi:hypothetical protein
MFAKNLLERTDAIGDFLATDSMTNTLVIVDKNNTDDVSTILEYYQMEAELICQVNVICESNTYSVEPETEAEDYIKTIYIRHDFDDTTMNLINTFQPLLAIFT